MDQSELILRIKRLENAVRTNPLDHGAHLELGRLLELAGDSRSAEIQYAEILRANPRNGEALAAAGNLYLNLGRFQDALVALNGALALNPNKPELLNNLGVALQYTGHPEKAEASFRKAIELSPNYAAPLNNLGALLVESLRSGEATEHLIKALSIDAENADAFNSLGNAYLGQGDKENAISSYEKALEFRPDFTTAHLNLSQIKNWSSEDEQVNDLLSLLNSSSLTDRARSDCYLALANAYFGLGDKRQAMTYLNEGNRLRKLFLRYEIGSDEKLFQQLKSRFNGDLDFRALEPDRPCDRRPLFILGMPRSGTTLLEQMLDCHSQICGMGELPYLSRAIKLSESGNPGLSAQSLNLVRSKYLASVGTDLKRVTYATDKTPLNFRWIGYIVNAMPEAKIIHLKRDPIATCWSNYKHSFATRGLGFSYDMIDVAKFFKLYESLMQHWQKLYPEKFYTLEYESLTMDPERELTRLTDYLELEWERSMLDFSKSRRAVHTSSALQVRQSLYQGSSQDWKDVEEYIQPMLVELARSN